jgi:DNA-directed RNA polymerase subunit E'/Rpb7
MILFRAIFEEVLIGTIKECTKEGIEGILEICILFDP